jgi:hypothetical protein
MTSSRARPPVTTPVPRMPPVLRSGRCVTHPDPGLWSAPVTDPPGREAAIRLCQSCPALEPCRAWSLSLRTADDLDVILGGLDPSQRAAIRRARQRALRKAAAA